MHSAGLGVTLDSIRSRTYSESSSNMSDEHLLYPSPQRVKRHAEDTHEEKQKRLDHKIEMVVTQRFNKQMMEKMYKTKFS